MYCGNGFKIYHGLILMPDWYHGLLTRNDKLIKGLVQRFNGDLLLIERTVRDSKIQNCNQDEVIILMHLSVKLYVIKNLQIITTLGVE